MKNAMNAVKTITILFCLPPSAFVPGNCFVCFLMHRRSVLIKTRFFPGRKRSKKVDAKQIQEKIQRLDDVLRIFHLFAHFASN